MKISPAGLLFPVCAAIGCSTEKAPLPDVEPQVKARLVRYIENNHMKPEDYVISKFKDHDIIFIGEWHRIKHDAELIRDLIPGMYDAGVYILGTEFARREDQSLIDSLTNGGQYDQMLAERITFLNFVHWGYEEYVDIFKAAWELNHHLPAGSRAFRILGLGDSPDWSIVKTQADRDKDEIRKKVWRGGGEEFWARVILEEAVAKNEKALVYCGIHHAFTEYRQPVYDVKKNTFVRFVSTRMGNYVYDRIGKRAITIYLHAPWVSAGGYDKEPVYPADGVIDAVMPELHPDYRRAGFDVNGTPFGDLSGASSFYRYGYENFRLEQFCDGYIYQKPLSEYEGVTPIKGFIHEDNIEHARSQSPNPSFRNASIEDFHEQLVEAADMRKRLDHLH